MENQTKIEEQGKGEEAREEILTLMNDASSAIALCVDDMIALDKQAMDMGGNVEACPNDENIRAHLVRSLSQHAPTKLKEAQGAMNTIWERVNQG